MFVCRKASRLPTVMVRAASTQNRGCHTSFADGNATKTSARSATNPAAFEATERKAVIGVGAPSYVSGAQVWKGTADTLKAKPTTMNMTARLTILSFPWPLARYSSMPVRSVVPDTP